MIVFFRFSFLLEIWISSKDQTSHQLGLVDLLVLFPFPSLLYEQSLLVWAFSIMIRLMSETPFKDLFTSIYAITTKQFFIKSEKPMIVTKKNTNFSTIFFLVFSVVIIRHFVCGQFSISRSSSFSWWSIIRFINYLSSIIIFLGWWS